MERRRSQDDGSSATVGDGEAALSRNLPKERAQIATLLETVFSSFFPFLKKIDLYQ